MMKRQTVIRAIFSMGLVFVLALTGCSDDDSGDGDGHISISVSEAPAFTGTVVSSVDEAKALFEGVMSSSFASTLTGIPEGLLMSKVTAEQAKKEFSVSVSMDKENTAASTSLTAISGITEGTITGSMKMSYKGPVAFSSLSGYMATAQKGDSVSFSGSSNITYTISGGVATIVVSDGNYDGTYKVAGTIKTENESSENTTVKDTDTKEISVSSKNVSKVSLALSISKEGGKGAKFVISAANSNSRNATGNSNYSDLQVYGNDNKLLFTIPNSGGFSPSRFIAGL